MNKRIIAIAQRLQDNYKTQVKANPAFNPYEDDLFYVMSKLEIALEVVRSASIAANIKEITKNGLAQIQNE